MKFQNQTWSWKHLAARLLLVPVVAGAAASTAKAQSYQPNWQNGPAPAMGQPTAPAQPAKPLDPKEMLKQGRKALSEGKLDLAQDCALKAEQAAAARKYSWSIFEDTPSSLRKDVLEAVNKANKAQAVELLKKARTLYAQKVGSDAERMGNLDLALNMATQAKSLHDTSASMWESDKAGVLIAEIKTQQEALRKKTGMAAAPPKPVMGAVPQPGMPAVAAVTPAKADVLRVVAEGRTLLAQDKVLEAKAAGDTARKMAEARGVLYAFSASDDSPDLLIAACKVKGDEMVKSLMIDCDKQLAMMAYDRANAACDAALRLAGGLGLYARTIEEKKLAIARNLKPATPTSVAMAPTTPSMPVADLAVPLPSLAVPPMPVMASKNVMLEQAVSELNRGDVDMARTLAVKAYNTDPAAKVEAAAVLRQIDVEVAFRKRAEAVTALNNALAIYTDRNYGEAQAVMMRINPELLAPDMKMRMNMALADCAAKLGGVVQAGATDDPMKSGMNNLNSAVQNANAPTPPVVISPVPMPTAVTEQPKPVADVAFEKLRTEAFVTMTAAGVAWNKGDTDTSMKLLEDYKAKVLTSTQPEPKKLALLKPIDARLDGYAKLKHTYDFELKETMGKIENRNKIVGERVAEDLKHEEIRKKVEEVNALTKAGKFKEAEALALQVKMLDPRDPTLTGLYEAAKYRRRHEDNETWKREDEQFFLDGMNKAERLGPMVDIDDPLKVNPARSLIAMRRSNDESILAPRTATERMLEATLMKPRTELRFVNMPLTQVIDQIRKEARINITIDTPSLEDEKVSLDSIIINEELINISLENALKIILSKAKLVHVIENEVVTITTEKRSKGRMKTKVFHVMDLVTPIPEYRLADHQTLTGAINSSRMNPALANGMMASPRNNMPGEIVGNGAAGMPNPANAIMASSGGTLQSSAAPNGINSMTPQRVQYAEQLKKMITHMVRQGSWAENGASGGGTIAYYDIGGAMVVNQTADVVKEVQDLLEALRRLQDLSVSVEIRVISLSETYFERIGVDFSANISTNNVTLEREIATGQFSQQPQLNSYGKGTHGISGYSPATGLTSDLGIPISPTSYSLSAPPFGGYQNSLSPTLNGGLSLGLAFLNDIQVYMFLEAAAGNNRINIMQAPKITLFNGQTSTVFVGDLAYFATGLQVYSANGQFVYLPVNAAFPIGQGFNPNSGGTGTSSGVSVTVQAIISADRRFVRLNLTPSLTALASATVPLYPITTFITPVFEGGSQGQPIPFTQFFQQPSFTEISAQTTVAIPDGGTVLLGGLKTMAQGRNEYGPPVLADIPYLNRLFKNVGIGQETRHVMMMVTPRIIINSEEEARQTGDGIGGGLPPQP